MFESSVDVSQSAGPLACMALYHGEEWLQSNCWYDPPSARLINTIHLDAMHQASFSASLSVIVSPFVQVRGVTSAWGASRRPVGRCKVEGRARLFKSGPHARLCGGRLRRAGNVVRQVQHQGKNDEGGRLHRQQLPPSHRRSVSRANKVAGGTEDAERRRHGLRLKFCLSLCQVSLTEIFSILSSF